MGEFRIGRKKAKHFYPERRHGSALFLYARNFATGPKAATPILAETNRLPWNNVDIFPQLIDFTVAAGGTTISVAGDFTRFFAVNDLAGFSPPGVDRTITTPPVFAAGFTTFDIDSPLDGVTTAGQIDPYVDVPITPISSGKILVEAVIVVINNDAVPHFVTIELQVNGVIEPLPDDANLTIAAGGFLAIPLLAEITRPVGVTAQIQILATAEVDGQLEFAQLASSLSVEEVNAATG